MAQVPTGTTLAIATAFGAAKAVTVVTNASEAVVTAVAHGYNAGDIVEVTSGWGRLNLRYARVKSPTTDTFLLEGFDTTSLTYYPAGLGIGSVRKVTTFTPITQVTSITSSGGDAKTVNYKYLESDAAFSINDGFDPTNFSINVDADSIGTAGYSAMKSLTDVQTNTALKITTRNGGVIYSPCTTALNEAVQFQDGQINIVKCAFNGTNKATRYAS